MAGKKAKKAPRGRPLRPGAQARELARKAAQARWGKGDVAPGRGREATPEKGRGLSSAQALQRPVSGASGAPGIALEDDPLQLMPPRPGSSAQAREQAILERRRVRDDILLEGGQRLGDVMDPWQREDFEALDDPRFRHAFLERPRGHSKTGDIGSEAVVELLAGAPNLKLFCYAADEDQARILFDDVKDKLIRGGRVQIDKAKLRRGKVRVLKNQIISWTGSILKVQTADVATSWGLRPDWIAMDEICEWRYERLWESLWTATGKRPNARVLVISTAGWDQAHFAWGVRQMAEREDDWYFSTRGQCASWIDPKWLEQQERSLPAHVYARLHKNLWVDGVGAFLTAAEVDAIFTGDFPEAVGRTVIGADIGLTKDLTVLAPVMESKANKLLLVLGLQSWSGTKDGKVDLTEVEEAAYEASKRYHAPVWADPFQAVQMLQRLKKRGRKVHEFAVTAESRRKLFGLLLGAIRDRRLRCRPHEALRKELLSLEVQETLSGYRVDHKVGRHDDHAFAVALAIAGLAERPEEFSVVTSWVQSTSRPGRVEGGRDPRYGDAPIPVGYSERGDMPRPPIKHDVDSEAHRVDCRVCRAAWKRSP